MDRAGPDLEGPQCAEREGAPPGGEARPGLGIGTAGRSSWEVGEYRGGLGHGTPTALVSSCVVLELRDRQTGLGP